MSTSRANCFHESSPTLYVMRILTIPSDVSPNTLLQEKLNEAVMVLNKSLQVGTAVYCMLALG
jgi:hypothetical protein